jgi:hypothetical protein
MMSERDTGEHAGTRDDTNPLQMSLFGGGGNDQP